MPGHINIPFFVVHMGCPNQCAFCDQRLISGESCFSEENVRRTLEDFLSRPHPADSVAEIAFFGGSFTGIERGLMLRLLDTAQSYVGRGAIAGIRMSTRPDYIDEEILAILSHYTVAAVEVGIQSFSDEVLRLCRRGHDAACSERACRMLREAGIPFAGQMMIGLPGSSGEDEQECARRIAALGASGYRVYPTLVFRGTELAAMTESGRYSPLAVPEAVRRMSGVMDIFERAGVPCLRAGLCESESLHDAHAFLAGPNHPAIGALARGELMYARIKRAVQEADASGCAITICVPPGTSSIAAGQNRRNILRLTEELHVKSVKIIENPALIGYNITIDKSEIIPAGKQRR